ncbi:MAG TPA: sigma 54-interacting transcriptional regulator [Polyangiaceae bacterium]
MARLANAQITEVSSGTDTNHEPPLTLLIRWVFPDSSVPVTPLDVTPLVLGRDEDCSVQLPGTETSRYHAEIARLGPLLVIRDLKSRNGVYLNGARIHEGPLAVGSVLRLGESIGIVVRAHVRASADLAELAPGFFGGPVLRPAIELARRAAEGALPMILQGETGSGKEVLARAIHGWSGRTGPFRAVNCAALPHELAEAELFGYRKGAFTGAERGNPGHFRAAHGGTLLLDEIADMPLALQAKVLRVLEEREVLPLGESQSVAVDVRVLAAAQRPLQRAVAEQKFRADLLARLDGLTIRLPPLRERLEELPWLLQRLLHKHTGGDPPALEARFVERLCLHDWPFNVRELDLMVRRLVALHGNAPLLRRSHLLPEWFGEATPHTIDRHPDALHAPARPPPVDRQLVRATQQRRATHDLEALREALHQSGGNLTRAAAQVGISRQRAYRLFEGSADVRLDELRESTSGAAPPVGSAVSSSEPIEPAEE